MLRIQMICGELAPYRCHGGLGIAAENLCAQLVSLGASTEVFFPLLEGSKSVHSNTSGLNPFPIDMPFDMANQLDSELAPGLTHFCQKALRSMDRNSNTCFVAHDNEAAVSVVFGKEQGRQSIFWMHSLYDHPVRLDFPKSVQRLMSSDSLLASAINDSCLFVTSGGVLKDALSIIWPQRLRDTQRAIQEAHGAGKIVIVESLGLLKERCLPTQNLNIARKYGLTEKPFVLFPSRPVLSKGIGFIQTVAKVMRDENLMFVAVGKPSNEIRRMCPNISWIPWLEKHELFALMGQASVIVHPSLTEGYGLAAAESAKYNNKVLCHPVGGLHILTERNLVDEVSITNEELSGLYTLWSDLLTTQNNSEAVRVWHEQSASFKKLTDKWIEALSRKVLECGGSSGTDQQYGDASWNSITWGETLLTAINKLQPY
jgi:glycosyltransferase involved in cell wall biosynthesis